MLSTEARQRIAHMGRSQMKAFTEAALQAAELWQHHEESEVEKAKAVDAAAALAGLLEDMGA